MIISSHRTIPFELLPPLPVSLKAVGYYFAKENWTEYSDGRTRTHCGVFWCESGSAFITINKKKHLLKAGNFIYYYPHDAHKIDVVSDHFKYYWMIFDGPLAVSLLQSFQFMDGDNFGGIPPKDVFQEAAKALSDGTMDALYQGSCLVYRLLTCMKMVHRPQEQSDGHFLVMQFKKIVIEEIADKNLSIGKIAARLKCHRTTLTRLVRKHIGFLPGQYMKHIRLQYATELLQQSNYTAAEISELCGFSTPEFFSRCFRKMTGEPPKRFRNHF